MISDWQTSIAHPSVVEWLTVTAYLVAGSLSARAAGRATFHHHARDRIFWRVTAVLMVLLGINKTLDFQTLFTAVGRASASASGWYGDHRRVQYAFVVGLGLFAVLTGIAMLRLTRRSNPAMQLALAGLVVIGLFALLRAASIHHLGEILGQRTPDYTWGSVQEMTGIVVVSAAAAWYARQHGTNP